MITERSASVYPIMIYTLNRAEYVHVCDSHNLEGDKLIGSYMLQVKKIMCSELRVWQMDQER